MSSEIPKKTLAENERNAIGDEVEQQIEAKMRGVKIQIKSVFDTIETLQQTQSIFQKEMNLKMGAITGHNTRKEKKNEEWTFPTLEAAIDHAKKIESEKKVQKLP